MEDKSLSLLSHCRACQSECCYSGPVSISAEERNRIIDFINKPELFSIDSETEVIQINNQAGKACHFLDPNDKTCTIQHIKPYECEAYPVLVGENGSLQELIVAELCPAKAIISKEFKEKAIEVLERINEDQRKKYYKINIKTGHC